MNSREKLLGVAVGLLLFVVGGYMLFDRLEQGLSDEQRKIAQLDQQKSTLERKVREAKQARKRWTEYRERSLPADPELAHSLYQKWLLKEIESVGMSDVTLNVVAAGGRGEAYRQNSMKVTCKGDIRQLAKWLHQFYSVDMLHRIRQLTMKPQPDSKLLDLVISIEAISLADADQTELPSTPSGRLQRDGLDPYLTAIVERNLFSPANRPPRLATLSSQRGAPKKMLSFTVKAEDPDKLDQVAYRLVEGPPGSRVDAKSGAFQWIPPATGEFDATIEATDDGLPSRSSKQKVRLVVVDPPPPEPVAVTPPPKRKLDFDAARHAVLTGIIDAGSGREVWLTVRTSGEVQKLHVGDSVQIGSIEGKIERIGEVDFELATAEKRLLVTLGEHLLQAREIDKPASDDPTTDEPASTP